MDLQNFFGASCKNPESSMHSRKPVQFRSSYYGLASWNEREELGRRDLTFVLRYTHKQGKILCSAKTILYQERHTFANVAHAESTKKRSNLTLRPARGTWNFPYLTCLSPISFNMHVVGQKHFFKTMCPAFSSISMIRVS